jgi:hypothetical protein
MVLFVQLENTLYHLTAWPSKTGLSKSSVSRRVKALKSGYQIEINYENKSFHLVNRQKSFKNKVVFKK